MSNPNKNRGTPITNPNRDQPAQPGPLLAVHGMSVAFAQAAGETVITRDVSFTVAPGERVGVVGESGCGKSVTGLALMGLLPRHTARVRGEIRFQGQDLTTLSARQMRRLRGKAISMIFQEPMSALDPVFTVGQQLVETLRSHEKIGPKEARERAVEALAEVGIPSPGLRIDDYPHQFSGGMRQRVMIAMALICRPQMVIADEPTTALDVTVQAQIIDLLCRISDDTGTAVLFITHDLSLVAGIADRVAVMHGGRIVEDADVFAVFDAPQAPYTQKLLSLAPRLGTEAAHER